MRSDTDAYFQFLNSVISSIGSNNGAFPKPPPSLPQQTAKFDGEMYDDGHHGSSLTIKAAAPNQKRKAEEALPRSTEKVLKTTSYRGSSSMLSTHKASQQTLQVKKTENAPTNPVIQTLPTRGLNRPPSAATPATIAPKSLPPEGTKVPKKGSYAEIMARAKAAQEAPPAVGIIKHQAKDKKALSHKKELMLQKKGKLGTSASPGQNGHSRHSSSDLSNTASKKHSKTGSDANKKVPELAYKGTAKPIPNSKPQLAYKGTMRAGTSALVSGQKKPVPQMSNGRQAGPRCQYKDYSEEEESEVEEEGGYSDESDDMEAGFDDVEEEETKATKMARKEDEEEARMEAELKRQKEAKKKRLQDLVKKQQAKKPVY